LRKVSFILVSVLFLAIISVTPINTNSEDSLSIKILIDASKDGGVWWYPQAGPFNSSEPHQGKVLADYFRSLGHEVDELGKDVTFFDFDLLNQYDIVFAIAAYGNYLTSELDAYVKYVSNGGILFIISDHHGESCNLPESFGLEFKGTNVGENAVTEFADHSITNGVTNIQYFAGSGLVSYPKEANIIGWLSNDTFIDLNGNNLPEEGEPFGAAVLGYLDFNDGVILFLGDTNGLEGVSQPFTDNYLSWLLQQRIEKSVTTSETSTETGEASLENKELGEVSNETSGTVDLPLSINMTIIGFVIITFVANHRSMSRRYDKL
jgi:hypothetical protein